MNADRLNELVNGFVDGILDDEGHHELSKLLDEDPEARRVFVQAVDQHQALRELKRRPVAVPRGGSNRLWIIGGVAAAVVIAVGVGFYLSKPDPVAPTPVVRRIVPPPPEVPTPVVVPAPQPPPVPPPTPPAPVPVPQEKPVTPPAPEKPVPPPPAPEPPPGKPAPLPPPPPAPKVTAVAVATLDQFAGAVHVIAGAERKAAVKGQPVLAGEGIQTSAGPGSATVRYSDGTTLVLGPDTLLKELSLKRVIVGSGSIVADVAKQPAGQPMIFQTPHAEMSVVGTKLAIACGAETRLEVKEGKVKLTRFQDKRSVDVTAGQFAVAAEGDSLVVRKSTRGWMMADPAIWGEDFEDPRRVETDWKALSRGASVTYDGPLEIGLGEGQETAEGQLYTIAGFTAPFRISVDIEYTSRLKNSLVAVRLHSRKDAKDFIHADLDESRYYLMLANQTVTADLGRKAPHRERWAIEVHADGAVVLLVDGKVLLRNKRAKGIEEFNLTLMARLPRDVGPAMRVRFDNVLVERLK